MLNIGSLQIIDDKMPQNKECVIYYISVRACVCAPKTLYCVIFNKKNACTFCVHSPVKTLMCAPTKLSFERRAQIASTAFLVTCSKTACQKFKKKGL